MHDKGAFTILVDEFCSGKRLDVVIASRIADCSRSFLAQLIRDGKIKIQGEVKKPGYRVRTGDQICGHIPLPEPVVFEPEPIPIDLLYEDKHLFVVNKQPGLVVHPAPGHRTGTLVNALLYHCPGLKGIDGALRPGVVHRLDKDTSGALIVAKTTAARNDLLRQFKSRTIKKEYLALVQGEMESAEGTISLPVGRHPVDRKRMSTISRKGREAETSWRVRERFEGITYIELNLKTGRTHQIRVHCAAINHPIIGDPVYGGFKRGRRLSNKADLSDRIGSVPRQMLHAWRLQFTHPVSETIMSMEAPVPEDMEELTAALRG